MGTWESSGTPKNLELNCRGQNTLPWGVFYTVGKVLKRRCWKWPRMSHFDICNTSYGQKKGRESNWQFDSRPLKVRNRPDSLACRRRATYHWKALDDGYNLRSYAPSKSRESQLLQFWDSHLGASGQKAIWMWPRGEAQSILHRGKWWLPPSPGRGESCESKVACGSS
jgi:hypothetical protein